MPREGDERAVTVVIGAVLMFGILITSLAMYQVNVVPDQNQGTEWDHHQEVTADLLDLRNAVVNAGNQDSTSEVSIALGAQYESRTFSINPPDPQGTIRTNSTGDTQVEIIRNGKNNLSFDTSFIEYEPSYNEYDAPTTVIEHGLVYDEHGDVNVTRDAGSVVSENRIVIPLIEGDFSESGSSSISVTVETINVSHRFTDVDEIQLTTNAFEAWNESYEVSENGSSAVINPDGREVYIAQIAIGDDRSGNTDTSTDLDSFGEPVTSESNEFDLAWKNNSVNGSPDDPVRLTATIDEDVENAYADFSLRDSEDIATLQRDRSPFNSGEATVKVEISNEAVDDDEVQVYVSSGGTTKKATLTVRNDGGPTIDHLDAQSVNHANHARFDAEWEATAGDSNITSVRIELIEWDTGQVVDDVTYRETDIDGQNPSDYAVELENKHGAGQEYVIRLTVEDANGNITGDEIVRTG